MDIATLCRAIAAAATAAADALAQQKPVQQQKPLAGPGPTGCAPGTC
jgi:hypothetical protein